MAERDVRMTFRISDDGTLSVLDSAGRKLREVGGAAEDAGRRGGLGFSKLQAGIVSVNQALDLTRRVYAAVEGPIRAVISASTDQDKATRLLNSQLQISGQFSESYSRRLQDQASALQKLTATSDESVLGVQRQLIAFGASEKNIDRLTRAALDLAAGLGTDVSTATLQLGKALQGEFGSLSRFGIKVEENATAAQKFEQALGGVESKFQGRAAAAAQTFEGRLTSLSLTFGELLEPLGDTITQSEAVAGIIDELEGHIENITEQTAAWVKENRGLIDEKITTFFDGIKDGLPEAAEGMAKMATSTASFVSNLGPLFEFVTSHPEIAAVLFLGARAGSSAAGAALGLGAAASGLPGLAGLAGAAVGVEVNRRAPEGGAIDRAADALADEIITAFVGRGGSDLLTPGALERIAQDPEAWRRLGQRGGRSVRLPAVELGAAVPGFGVLAPETIDALRQADLLDTTAANFTPGSTGVPTRPGIPVDPGKAAKDAKEAAKLLAEHEKAAQEALTSLYKDQLATLEAQADRRSQLVDFAEQDLAIAKNRGASDAELFDIARRVDAEREASLQHQSAQLELQFDWVNKLVTAGQASFSELTEIEGAQERIAALLERQRQGVGSVVSELERQRDVVVDLRDVATDAQRRVVDGILNSGGNFKIDGIVEDTVKVIGSDLISGLLEANARGGKLFVAGWQETLGGLTRSFREGFGEIGGIVNQFGALSGGTLRNVPGLGRFFGSSPEPGFVEPGTPGSTNLPGLGAVDSGTLAAAESQGLVSGAGGQSAGSAASALPIVGLAVIAIQAVVDAVNAARTESHRFGATDNSIAGAAYATLPVIGQIVKLVGEEKAGAFLRGPGGAIIDPVGFALSRWAFQAPTLGTQTKKELSGLLEDAGLPRQRVLETGGRSGVRSPRLEEAATAADIERFRRLGLRPGVDVSGVSLEERLAGLDPLTQGPRAAQLGSIVNGNAGVNELRFGAGLGLFTAIFGETQGTAGAATNAFINNAQILGLSVEETQRQIRKLADAAGINLVSGLEEVNRLFLEGKIPLELFTAASAGMVDIFEKDIPAGVDVAAIHVRNFAERGGLNIANFTEELETAMRIFGALEDAERSGLRSGVNAGLAGIANRQSVFARFEAGSATLGDVQKAQTAAREDFADTLTESVRVGLNETVQALAFDKIEQSQLFKDLLETVAQGPQGGDIGDIKSGIEELVDKSIPELEAMAATLAEINSQLGATPSALAGSAADIRSNIADARFGALNRRDQEAFLKGRIGDVRSKIDALKGDAIADSAQVELFRPLLEELSGLGFQFGGVAAARFQPGSRRARSAQEGGLAFSEFAASEFERLGIEVKEAQDPLVSAIKDWTTEALAGRLTTDQLTSAYAQGLISQDQLTGALRIQTGSTNRSADITAAATVVQSAWNTFLFGEGGSLAQVQQALNRLFRIQDTPYVTAPPPPAPTETQSPLRFGSDPATSDWIAALRDNTTAIRSPRRIDLVISTEGGDEGEGEATGGRVFAATVKRVIFDPSTIAELRRQIVAAS